MRKHTRQTCTFESDLRAAIIRQKMGQPKLQNWFSWNQQMWDHQLHDFFVTTMVLDDQLPDEPDPGDTNCFSNSGPAGRDPRAQLRAILQHGGGVRLAYKLMTNDLHSNEKVLWVAEKASWDWYTNEIKHTRTPHTCSTVPCPYGDGVGIIRQFVHNVRKCIARLSIFEADGNPSRRKRSGDESSDDMLAHCK